MQLHSLHNIMVTHNQILKSISHSEPLCPLAETVVSLFAPNKQLVIISLAIKLNHIPGKGNVAVVLFFFSLKMGEESAFLKIQTYNYYCQHDHYTSLTREVYVLFD